MRLALRTLFWLVLAAAVAIGWGVEHSREAARLAETRRQSGWPYGMSQPATGPSANALKRKTRLAELARLSDPDFLQWFHGPHGDNWPGWDLEYDLGLSELIRRGMVEELQRQHDALLKNQATDPNLGFPNNLKLLTALRRAQGKPDPLMVHVEVRHEDRDGKPTTVPQVAANIENVDVGQESVFLEEGGDYRSGRPERWRVQLVDREGGQVPDSNFPSDGPGGGMSTMGPLDFGKKGRRTHLLDARCYIAPPLPGKYQLQLIHSERGIAGEPDLTGLIVLKSESIEVVVTRPPPQAGTFSVVPLLAILGIGGVWLAIGIVRRRRRKSSEEPAVGAAQFSWRDAAAFVLVAGLAVAWWCDSRYLAGQIRASQRDQDADWSMRLAE